MEIKPNTIRSFFFALALVHGAFISSLLCLSIGVLTITAPEDVSQPMASTARYIALAVMSATTGAGFLMFPRLIRRSLSATLNDKLQTYRMAIIVRSALFELGGLTAAVMSLLTGDQSLLLLTGVAGILLLLYRPSRLSFLNTMPLKNEEQAALRD